MVVRQHPRFSATFSGTLVHQNRVHRISKALDLSRKGCRLRLGEELTRGLQVIVRLSHLPTDGGSPLSAEVAGDVIWSRLEGLSYQTGIHFYDDPPSLLGLLVALDDI